MFKIINDMKNKLNDNKIKKNHWQYSVFRLNSKAPCTLTKKPSILAHQANTQPGRTIAGEHSQARDNTTSKTFKTIFELKSMTRALG